ncbi:MAG: hypothetical protein ACP5GJ_00090 [Nanopusillaceae archaeon]
MDNKFAVTFKKIFGFLLALAIVAFAVKSQQIVIEPQASTLLGNYISNGLTFTVKLLGVEQKPYEAYLYFNIYGPNNNLIYQYYEPIAVYTGNNIYTITVNPQILNLAQQQQVVQTCTNYVCTEITTTVSNITVNATVALIYQNNTEKLLSQQQYYSIVYLPYNLSLSIVQLPQVISQQQVQEYGLNVQSVVYVQNTETNIQSATLTLTLYNSQGNIVYQTQENINLQPGENLVTMSIPNYYLQNVEGQMYITEQLNAVLVNGQVLTQYTTDSFYISNNQYGGQLEVLSISPNFNKLTNLGSALYNINLLLENPGYQTVNATIQLLLYDQYGNLIYNLENSQLISPQQQGEIIIPFSTIRLSPGYYTIILYLYENGVEINEYTYQITVNEQNIQPVNVLNVYANTFNVKPGSFVELYLELESNLPMDLQVTPMVESQQLNMLQQLSTITLSPNTPTQLPVVIYIPEGLEAGYYPITFVFNYNGIAQQYTYNLYVNGTVPVYYPITASLIGYKQLTIGKNTTIYLVLSANTTQIYNLLVQAYAVGGKVYPEQQTVQIGGTYSEQIPLNVTAESNNVTVYVDIIDQNTGKVLFTLNQTYTAYGTTTQLTIPSEEIIFWILVIVAIIIIASILAESRIKGGKGREKVEE